VNDAPPPSPRGHSVEVFGADAIRVVSGAGEGAGLGPAARAHPGDIYQLSDAARPLRLLIDLRDPAAPRIAQGSGLGAPGGAVAHRGRLVLMSPEGDRVDLELVEIDAALYGLPLSPLLARRDYVLLRASPPDGAVRLSDLACAAFAEGTRIALGDGGERAIEALQVGDPVLTRDNGSQPLRWIGQTTLRAAGRFAPVRFAPGVLGNAAPLQLSPQHRVFLYQRGDRRLGPRAEVLVQARMLVDGDRVQSREGGRVRYLSLAFDRHEIIYAEGTPVESLPVSAASAAQLPADLAEDLRARFPGLRQRGHFAPEADPRARP